MKRIYLLSVLVVLLTGCFAPAGEAVKMDGRENYFMTVLGDLHFDGKEYHITEPQWPGSKRERERNLAQWQGKSQLVLDAANKASSKDTPFIIQLGDITQGDCDNVELQSAAFKDVFGVLKKYFPGRKIFSLTGNHDNRGMADAPDAVDEAFVPLLKNELGADVEMDGSNYAVLYGRDLYIFYDYSKRSSAAFVKKMLTENPDTRHVFFLTHLPMFPCSNGNPGWLVGGFDELIPLLAERGAVVLCAHTHYFGHQIYKCEKGILPQLSVVSMGYQWTPGAKITEDITSFDQWKSKIRKRYYEESDYKDSIKRVAKFKNSDFIKFIRYKYIPSGFVNLEVTQDKVVAHIHTDNSGKAAKSIVLKGE